MILSMGSKLPSYFSNVLSIDAKDISNGLVLGHIPFLMKMGEGTHPPHLLKKDIIKYQKIVIK